MPTANAYCQCEWDARERSFSREVLSSLKEPLSAEEEAFSVLMIICRRELPEAKVKDHFAKECRNDKPELGAYCDCAWTTKRKTQSVGELANGAGITARKELMKECAGKISEAAVKKAFMSVCREARRAGGGTRA